MTKSELRDRTLDQLRWRGKAEDAERREFMKQLDAADFEVTDWEAQFLQDHLSQPRPFTNRQRETIDDMRKNYGARIRH